MGRKGVKMKMKMSPAGNSGFTYLQAMVVIIVIGITAETAYIDHLYVVRKDQEQELIFRGTAYVKAIKDYYRDQGYYPRKLENLMTDGKTTQKRYIRQLYSDPLTDHEWKVIRAIDGGILGVFSSSRRKPFKQVEFPDELKHFEHQDSYENWTFK